MAQGVSDQHTPSTFFDYRRTEINLVTDLKRLQIIAEKVKLEPATIQLVEDSLSRNKEHKFSVAVVGEFKRGKSTFINALLGKQILPADIEPCSATLNRITYGLKPGVKIHFRDRTDGTPGSFEEIGIDQLSAYVTKLTPESEQMAATVKEAVVTYPLGYLMNNVEIIDTPGLNDDVAMTEVTLSVLPHVAAAILVIMPEAPFAGSEADFLNNQLLLQDMGRVIFVVTAIDRVRKAEDRERILEVIRKRIRQSVERRLLEQFGSEESPDYKRYRKQIGEPRLFGLSGYEALEAKETDDRALLEKSRFPEFEEKLEQFVTETRGAVELQVLANRTLATSNEILKKLTMELGAMQMSQRQFDQAYSLAMSDLQALRHRRQEEVLLIDQAAEKTRQRIRPMIDELGSSLKRAAGQVLAETEINSDDVGNAAFVEDLGKQIAATVRTTGRRHSETIQMEIERDVTAEVQRLGNYASTVTKALNEIEMQFASTAVANQASGITQNAVASAVGGLLNPLWGGALGGWQEAGGRGAAVGFGASLGAFAAGATVLYMLSLPVSLPVSIGLGVVAAISGKYAARFTFREYRIDKFRQEMRTQVFAQIDEQLSLQRPDVTINQFIGEAYQAIKDKLVGELDATIEQTRSNLDQLRSQKAREETLAEQQLKETEALIKEVQDIRSRAQGLSSQLIEVTMV